MKINYHYIFFIAILGAQTSELLAQNEISKFTEQEKQIITLTNDFAKSWEDLNADKYLNYFSPSLDFYIEGELIGFDIMEGIVRTTLPNLKQTTFQILEPKVHYANSSTAVISFKIEETFLDKNDKYEEINGAMTLVWQNENENWKIIVVHESIPQIKAEN